MCNCILPCSAQLLKQPHQTHSCSVAKNAKRDGALPKRRPRSAERNNELWRQVESVLAKSRADTRQTKWALNRCSCYAARPQATKVVDGARTAAVMWGEQGNQATEVKKSKMEKKREATEVKKSYVKCAKTASRRLRTGEKQQRRANFLVTKCAVCDGCPRQNCRFHCACVRRAACNTRSHQNFTTFPKYAQRALVAQLAAHKTRWSSLWKWFIANLVELNCKRIIILREGEGREEAKLEVK